MTTCKHCGKRRENHYEKIDGRACCNPNGKGTVFEPSTEGTQAAQPVCTCMKDGSAFCKFPHPCRRCNVFHPGVSCYWNAHGKTAADRKSGGRTFVRSDGSRGCDECCNGDRCDDRTHRDRENCEFCLGSGEVPAPVAQVDAGKSASIDRTSGRSGEAMTDPLKSGVRDNVPDSAICGICQHRCDQHGDWGRWTLHFTSPCQVPGCMCGDFWIPNLKDYR